MKALIFFDINGTLIKRDSRTDIPYARAIDLCLGITDGMKDVNTSARSDKDVFMEVLEKSGIEFSEALWIDFLGLYETQLQAFNTTDVWRENADAVPFVEALSKTTHKMSMITGELRIGAAYKLKKIGIWDAFETGGFGEDGLTRFEIADVAMQQALERFGNDFDEMFVIGDTLLDIKTARHLGAKIISIATGSNTKEELATLSPDYLIESFEEIDHLFL
jgi:phosphoglycolate phosphatase-like HAD superfamily hydrolase